MELEAELEKALAERPAVPLAAVASGDPIDEKLYVLPLVLALSHIFHFIWP